MLKKMNNFQLNFLKQIYICSFQFLKYSFILSFLLISAPSFANTKDKILPRFVTVKSDHVNARTGPGVAYPIDWVFISRSEPLKITAEFEQWRRVEDINGPVGWVHSSVLSPKRSIIIMSNKTQELYRRANKDSRIVAKLENGLRCSLDKVEKKWCKVKCQGYKGWIESNYVWGLSETE